MAQLIRTDRCKIRQQSFRPNFAGRSSYLFGLVRPSVAFGEVCVHYDGAEASSRQISPLSKVGVAVVRLRVSEGSVSVKDRREM